MKEMRYFSWVLLLFASVFYGSAQDLVQLQEHNGKLCHVIEVTDGLNLFTVVQQTGYSGEEILKCNPGSDKGLISGQKLYLPIERKTIIHKVCEKETLFAISKRYAVSVDSLISWNLDSDKGIQVGQNVQVKNAAVRLVSIKTSSQNLADNKGKDSISYQRNFEFNDTIMVYIVENGESLYSLSKRFMVSVERLKELNGLKNSQVKVGASIKIPINDQASIIQGPRPIPKKIDSKSKRVIEGKNQVIRDPKIAVFLPFAIDTIKFPLKGASRSATEFYMGALIGIKDLEAIGLKGQITFYDYLSESTDFPALLETEELVGMDLIYAPFHLAQAQLVSDFCQKNKIKIVFPIHLNSSFNESNPYAIQIPTPNNQLALNLAKDLYGLQKGEQIVLVRSNLRADSLLEEAFLAAYKALPNFKGKAKIIMASYNNYMLYHRNTLKTWFVSFDSQKQNIINLLSYTSQLENVQVFGLKEWLDFKEVSSTIENVFEFNYESPTYFNTKEAEVIAFHKRYRIAYQVDISKMACLGFDMFSLIPKILMLDDAQRQGVISRIDFKQENDSVYKVNSASFLLKFFEFESIIFDNDVE